VIGVLTIVLIPARPLWEYAIKKEIEKGNNVLVVAHTNTLRGLMKHIDNIEGAFLDFLRIMWKFLIDLQTHVCYVISISEKDVSEVSMPAGIPFVYKVSQAECY
jgi:bisphosphoglycerate-dependent phosphoglycerate mutase